MKRTITIEFDELQLYTLSSILASFFETARMLNADIPNEFRYVAGSIIFTMKDALERAKREEMN